jgi:hypothetical protein
LGWNLLVGSTMRELAIHLRSGLTLLAQSLPPASNLFFTPAMFDLSEDTTFEVWMQGDGIETMPLPMVI